MVSVASGFANGLLLTIITSALSYSSLNVHLYQYIVVMLGIIVGSKLSEYLSMIIISPKDKMLGGQAVEIAKTFSISTAISMGIASYIFARWYVYTIKSL